MNSYGNDFGGGNTNWRGNDRSSSGGYRNQNNYGNSGGGYQKRGGAPRTGGFSSHMNPIETSNNYYRQPDYM